MNSTGFLFYFFLLGLFAYLAITAYLQISKTKQRDRYIAFKKRILMEAISEEEYLKEKVFSSIEKAYGLERADMTRNGIMWLGMPMEILRLIKGKAGDAKRQISYNSVIFRLYYGEYENRLKNTKYSLEVKVKDGFVIGWKDLP